MKIVAVEDGGMSRTASGPAVGPKKKAPPRTRAPGKVEVVLAPTRHISSLLKPAQPRQFVEFRTQSATHSARLPTMSKAPRAETQLLRAPVGDRPGPSPEVLQSVVPLSGPESGVPFAATCHSALVGSRLPALAHASSAWNHVMNAEGSTDGRLTAKMSLVQFWPLAVHGA